MGVYVTMAEHVESPPSKLKLTFGDCAYRAIHKHFKKTIKYKADVLKDRDPEPLHQMRVGMRRLRTALQVFAPAVYGPVTVRQVTKIAKALGQIRDLDVLNIWFQQYVHQRALTPAEALELELLLQRLQQHRAGQFHRIEKLLKGKPYRAFVDATQVWLQEPQYKSLAPLPIEMVLPDLLLPLISELLLHPAWMAAVTEQSGKVVPLKIDDFKALKQDFEQWEPLLHDLRKQMKRVRYQTEFFCRFLWRGF